MVHNNYGLTITPGLFSCCSTSTHSLEKCPDRRLRNPRKDGHVPIIHSCSSSWSAPVLLPWRPTTWEALSCSSIRSRDDHLEPRSTLLADLKSQLHRIVHPPNLQPKLFQESHGNSVLTSVLDPDLPIFPSEWFHAQRIIPDTMHICRAKFFPTCCNNDAILIRDGSCVLI